MSKTRITCEKCGKPFLKENKELNKKIREGTPFYCSRKCFVESESNLGWTHLKPNVKEENSKRIQKYCSNRRSQYSPFKFFMKVSFQRNKDKWSKSDLDLEYLKALWEQQKGICPYSGWDLELPDDTRGWLKESKRSRRASLDRIDNSRGYVKGNVRFVSYMANIARGAMEENELIEFCTSVANHFWDVGKRRS